MNVLNIDNINIKSPYPVWQAENNYVFTTEYGIEYSVSFDLDDYPGFTAYWFNLTNLHHEKSPGDAKIPQTLICIIEEFFNKNPDILLYLCSTDGNQQAQRARLFLRWFNGYEQQQRYAIKTTPVKGDETTEYVALIVQRTNPRINEIMELFDKEIAIFNENK